jgi:release factor glutamine methyltransferase
MGVIPDLNPNVSIAEAQQLMVQAFKLADIADAPADARLLLGHALRIDRSRLLSDSDRLLDAHEIDAVQALAARRLKHEPVSRILGRKEFWSLALDVSEAVLVPRPETETVMESALDFVVRDGLRAERLRILDIGTGSGALMLALLTELPQATGVATDISAAALDVARGNAERLDLSSRCEFIVCDIADGVTGAFDLIVSNPPYIAHDDIATLDPEVREYDPALALDGGADGLDAYRSIAAEARRLLAPGGRLFVELGAGQNNAGRALFAAKGLSLGQTRDDLAGIPRALGAGFEADNSP